MDIRKYIRIPWRSIKEIEKKKERIESLASVHISREKNSNIFEIVGKDGIAVEKGYLMVQAISLGFDLEDTEDLFEATDIKIINLKNYLSSKKAIIRQKSRIIGRKGLAKKKIEELGKCKIRIKGSKIGVIAKTEDIDRVLKCIESLISGKPHGYAYKYLEKK